MIVVATTSSQAPAIVKGTSRMSAAYAMVLASLLPRAIVKATLRMNAVYVVATEAHARRAARTRLRAITIHRQLLTMAHVHTWTNVAFAVVRERFMNAVATTFSLAHAIATGT